MKLVVSYLATGTIACNIQKRSSSPPHFLNYSISKPLFKTKIRSVPLQHSIHSVFAGSNDNSHCSLLLPCCCIPNSISTKITRSVRRFPAEHKINHNPDLKVVPRNRVYFSKLTNTIHYPDCTPPELRGCRSRGGWSMFNLLHCFVNTSRLQRGRGRPVFNTTCLRARRPGFSPAKLQPIELE